MPCVVAGGRTDIPKIFRYATHASQNSLYHTPPTFGIYLVRNVLAWAKGQGGLLAIERDNRKKASLVYGAIDAHAGFYRAPVEVSVTIQEAGKVPNHHWTPSAIRVPGEKLEWDSKHLRVTNSEAANKLLRRTYRKGWELDLRV